MTESQEYREKLKNDILADLELLTEYIKTDELTPDGKIEIKDLIEISDFIERCLGNWHY